MKAKEIEWVERQLSEAYQEGLNDMFSRFIMWMNNPNPIPQHVKIKIISNSRKRLVEEHNQKIKKVIAALDKAENKPDADSNSQQTV